ncbi:MAG: CRISPR-associated primase-polymerase type A1 [Eubacteriales bacterium]|nr:CRISPR-associated primase-polymerase type A1 [Eubacteriales bacterium]
MSLYNKMIDLQKLEAAWVKVRKNKPSCGVDQVTCEQFEENRKQELKQLHMELKDHTYKTLPVRKTVLYKEEKTREIALYSMRDKVVQQSIAFELNRIYEGQFSSQTYAYRNHKSALHAVEEIEERMKRDAHQAVLKLDIKHFFDRIQWPILKKILKRTILEEDVLDLIEDAVRAKMIQDTGELSEKTVGLYQGSSISPILSNVYLMDFDQWLAGKNFYFVRYSDDMLVMGENKNDLANLLSEIRARLLKLGLELNEEKTVFSDTEKGIDFLGYHISAKGKTVPVKAEQKLQDRLEWMWLSSQGQTLKEKIKKATEIIGGWEQYFKEEQREISVFEYVTLLEMGKNDPERLEALKDRRIFVDNIYLDIMLYLADQWKAGGEEELELLEYEQYYRIWSRQEKTTFQPKQLEQILMYYRKLVIQETEDSIVELMQLYTDAGDYKKAAYWMERKEKLLLKPNNSRKCIIQADSLGQALIYNKDTARRMLKILAGREDLYVSEVIDSQGHRQMELQTEPLTEQKVLEHLEGGVTIGTYIQRPNGTAKYLVIDIDVSKKILLQYERETSEFQAYLEKAYAKACDFVKLLHEFGMEGYIEYSGCRGYHVWTFFSEWIPVRYITMFTDILEERVEKNLESCISTEFFPNKTRIKPGKFGQVLKLPCGRHTATGFQSFFLDGDGGKVTELNLFLDGIAEISLNTMKKILATNSHAQEKIEERMVDQNLDAFEGASANVMEILKNCNLMRYLCQKAQKTGYLTHFERLSVLYVFGHLGEEGKQFVHQVMAYTLNYQYHATEKFIRKMPEKPISCVKLRDQYKSVTAEFGCNCSFKRSKNCYPSPVMHAISLSNQMQGDITLPTSRSIPREKQKEVINEINIHKKAQELAQRILKLKKEKRSLDISISNVEKELEQIYDDTGTDCLEIEMGILVRRKNEKGYEWLIEI